MHALLLGRVTEDSEGSDWVMKHLSNLLHREKAATQEGKDVWGEKNRTKKEQVRKWSGCLTNMKLPNLPGNYS